jgi:hypothetical protein
MITISTWHWGHKYGPEYVGRLARSVARHLKQPHEFVVFSNSFPGYTLSGFGGVTVRPITRGYGLTQIKGCFVRLQMFGKKWQEENGITDRIVMMDLDTVITGPLDPLFDRPEPFLILQGGNATNPCPFNGALQMLRPGYRHDVWDDFSFDKAKDVPHDSFPDDQAWLADRIPDAAGWKVGPETGAYVFRKPGWPGYISWDVAVDEGTDKDLPAGARLVTFSGWRSPQRFVHLPWISENWRT